MYLRRQDRLAVSLYSTILKLGGAADIFPSVSSSSLPYYFNYEEILRNYSDVVGVDNVRVRLYDPEFLCGGDVVKDFYHVAHLGVQPSITPRENESLSFAQAVFLEKFNKRFPIMVDGRINDERGDIFQAIKNTGAGARFYPARSEAQTFYSAFFDGNERVRARFLPEHRRPALFDESFREYPEIAPDWSLGEADFFDFLAAIWRYRIKDF